MKELAFKIRSKNEDIKTHSTVITDIKERKKKAISKREELVGKIDEATDDTIEGLEEELETVDSEIEEIEAEQEEANKKKKKLDKDLEELQNELDDIQEEPEGEGEERKMKNTELEIRANQISDYIKTRALPADGVVSGDVGVVIPEEITYAPENEVATKYDLSKYVTTQKVKTASGKKNIRKNNKGVLNTVAELEKNPALAKPQLEQVEWSVDTYRGALALSREAIDDAAVDLMNLVALDANEAKVNTVNNQIATILKTFTAKDAVGVDGLKDIINVEIDAAYDVKIIASQTFYNELDKLKDKEGRYLLQDSIAFATGKQALGLEVVVVSDELIGKGKAFIGDTRRAVLYSDRKEIGVRWVDHDIYGEYLQAGMRMGINKADAKAGFYVTLKPEPVTGE